MGIKISDIFNEMTRPNGETFYTTTDAYLKTPVIDWVRDSVHNGVFPNDFAYELARTIAHYAITDLLELSGDERNDRAHEIADDIAVSYSNKTSIANFIRYCDGLDVVEEFASEGLLHPLDSPRLQMTGGLYWFIERALQSFPYDTFTTETDAAVSA
jgi:hypothetical protein